MSKVFDAAGIAKAMHEACSFIGANPEAWLLPKMANQATIGQQQTLLPLLPYFNAELAKIPELKAWASTVAEDLNSILAKEGFNIRLDPWPKEDEADKFGVVSILDLAVKWIEAGDGTARITPGMSNRPLGPRRTFPRETSPAFKLDRVGNKIEFFESEDADPLIRIATQNGDFVWLRVRPKPLDQFGLYDAVRAEHAARSKGPSARFAKVEDVTIPKVHFRKEVDIDWMCGLTQYGTLAEKPGQFVISQAKQEVRFAMNEVGARAKTATALLVARSIAVDPTIRHVVVDDDFLLWIERPGVNNIPIFVGYFEKDSWKDPKNLDNV